VLAVARAGGLTGDDLTEEWERHLDRGGEQRDQAGEEERVEALIPKAQAVSQTTRPTVNVTRTIISSKLSWGRLRRERLQA
jgi:hypothetical protein